MILNDRSSGSFEFTYCEIKIHFEIKNYCRGSKEKRDD